MTDGTEQGPRGGEQHRDAPAGWGGARRRTVTLIPGEGVGEEVMSAMRRVLDDAGADVEWEAVEAGAEVRSKGIASGLPWETLDSIQRTGLVVRGPLTSLASGLESTDRLLHQGFDIAAQALRIRPARGIWTGLGERERDLWLVRNSLREAEPVVDLDLPGAPWPTSVPAGPCDARTFRRAFELAREQGAASVYCSVRTGGHGLLRVQRSFLGVAAEYPQVRAGCVDQYRLAQELVDVPERLEVVVTSNAVEDVVTELASRVAGGLAYVAAVEHGPEVVMFAPVHSAEGSRRGRGRASPVGALRAGVLLLEHLGQQDTAERIERGLEATLEQGLGTAEGISARVLADAVLSNLDSAPRGGLPRSGAVPSARRRWVVPRRAGASPR